MAFQNLPNDVESGVPNIGNLTLEQSEYNRLYLSLTRSQSGEGTFDASLGSGLTYTTNSYPSDVDVFNKGEEGLMNMFAKYVLVDYNLTGDTIQTISDNSVLGAEGAVKITDSFSADANRYIGNTKLVDDGQDVSLWTNLQGTLSSDATNVKIGDSSIRITENDNVANILNAKKDNITLDLSTLNNGEVSTDDDYVLFDFYISDISLINLSGVGVQLILSQDAVFDTVNIKLINLTTDLVSGWNYKKIKKSQFATGGGGAWSGIQSLRIGYESNINQLNEYVSFQLIQLVKKDPVLDEPNAFQYMGVAEFVQNSGEWFVGEEFGENIIRDLENSLAEAFPLIGVKQYDDFIINTTLKAEVVANASGFNAWYVDASNWIRASVFSNVFYLQMFEGGFIKQVTKPIVVNVGDKLTILIEKKGTKVIAICTKNINETIELSDDTTITGNGMLSTPTFAGLNSTIYSMSITEIAHAHHADIAETSKRTQAIQITDTALTIPITGWVASGNTSFPQKLDFDIVGVLISDDVTLVPTLDDQTIAESASMAANIDEYNGGVTIYAKVIPSASIDVIPTILKG